MSHSMRLPLLFQHCEIPAEFKPPLKSEWLVNHPLRTARVVQASLTITQFWINVRAFHARVSPGAFIGLGDRGMAREGDSKS
ncbi:hypothetical protein, partial [Paracoccus sp. NBH48]|uniref:hypothetical protein n=1 Tax=Paracoccus sp. NBH48 TaxID=2596918 RepID=UPI0019D6A612